MVTIHSTDVKSVTTHRCIAVLLSAALTTAGCSSITDYFPHFLKPYRPDVQQGNVITSDMVDQLRPGMTRDQVKFMLGTPLLVDGFHPDQWNYLYYLNPRVGAPQRRDLVIYFKDNRLEHFTSDPMPPESMADNLILGRKTFTVPTAPPKEPAKETTEPANRATAPASQPPQESTPQPTPPASAPQESAPPATLPATTPAPEPSAQTTPPVTAPAREPPPQATSPASVPPQEPTLPATAPASAPPQEPAPQATPPASGQ